MKHCLMIAGALMVVSLQAQNTTPSGEGFAVIKGHIKNRVDDFWDLGVNKYLGFTTVTVPVNKNGNFIKEVKVEGDALDGAVIFHLADYFPIFILKNDTIEINWDENDFIGTFTAKNSRVERDHDLQIGLSLHKFYKDGHAGFQDSLYRFNSDDSLRFSMINDHYNREIDILLADGVSEGTTKIATDIYFKYASLLLDHKLLPAYDLFVKHPSANSRLLPILNERRYYTTESESCFRSSEAYRVFLFNYVRFYLPFGKWIPLSGKTGETNSVVSFAPSWDDYYAGLRSFHLYEIRDWFITRSIIDAFGHYSFDDASAVYKDFMTKVRTSFYADTLRVFYANIQRLKPGNPAPGFTLKGENGKSVSLSDFKGKIVFIDFWGIHCSPCLYEIKNSVPALREKYKDKNIVFLNICVEGEESEWKEHLAKLNLQGVNLITEGWRLKNAVCNTYGVNGIPHYYIVDADGNIADNNAPRPSQGEILYSALDKLLVK